MDIELVKSWAREAGTIALRHYRTGEARRKPDRSFVTAADEEIERLLRARIREAYPQHGIVGEEGRNHHADAEYLWALDPIDGTGAFVGGLPIWGVSIGLLQRGHPVLGCFYLPALDECYTAGIEGPARFNDQPIRVLHENLLDSEAYICVPSNVHRRYVIDYPGKIRSFGSMAAYICYVARGSAAGAVIGTPKLWDIAASQAILERAGGGVHLLRTGTPLDLRAMLSGKSAPGPVIVGSPSALDLLHKRVRVRSG